MKRKGALTRLARFTPPGVLLLQAPAGFGKTTLLRQWCEVEVANGARIVWLSLDASDNDVTRFLASFATAIEVGLAGTDSAECRPARNGDLALWIVDRLMQAERAIVVFDDMESVHDPVVLGLLTQGIEALAPGALIAIGSRTVPSVGIARLRARGKLHELHADDLRFDAEETQRLLDLHHAAPALDSSQLQRLQQRTEGWVTALRLAALSLESQTDVDTFLAGFTGSNAAVAAYLTEDVLAKLPDDIRQFALRASVLDELEESLCNAVCECDDSLKRLAELERNGCFVVKASDQPLAYRFHYLFRNFLLNQLRLSHPKDLRALHATACAAYLAQARPIPAIRHALSCGNASLALNLLEQHLDDFLRGGRVRLLAEWLGQLPPQTLQSHQRLQMIHAWCVTFTQGPRRALAMVEKLDADQLEPEAASYLLALRPMLLAMTDNIESAHELAPAALERVPRDHIFPRAMLYQVLSQTNIILGARDDALRHVDQTRRTQQNVETVFGHVLAETAEGTMELISGHLRQAEARMKLANQVRGEGEVRHRGGFGNAPAAILWAECLYEGGKLNDSLRLLRAHVPLVQELGLPDPVIAGHVILARIASAQGDLETALQVLAELESSGNRYSLPRVVASARLERSQRYLFHGEESAALEQLDLAERTCDWADIESRWFVANDTLIPSIVRIRLAARRGNGARMVAPLRALLSEADRQRRTRRALKLRILLAEALQADQQTKLALRTMSFAVRTAQAEGFTSTFREEGPVAHALLHELQHPTSTGLDPDGAAPSEEVKNWLEALTRKNPSTPAAINILQDPLTAKEMEVLQLLAQGNSNDTLAAKLLVSNSTVRTHLRAINLKLHAANRMEAIAKGRELGLISA